MKKFILALVVAMVISACGSGNIVDSLEKQYNNIEEYRADYTVTMNDTQFNVTEEYKNKGDYHSIKIDAKGYNQEIELKGDKVILKNTNHDEVVEGKRENFNLPTFALIQVMEQIVTNKDTLSFTSENQIEINNGEILVTYEGKALTKVEMTLGGSGITIEYNNIEIK